MKLTDSRGLAVSTRSAAALGQYELAVRQALGYFGNPLATLDAALEEDPGFGAAHALVADLAVVSAQRSALARIDASARQLGRLGRRASAREQAHVAAALAWRDGRLERAAHLYGAIALEYPRDLVAIHAAHAIDFTLGDATMLRDRPAQAMPHWNAGVAGYGYLLGMYAFGLEETGNYARAEDVGRRAVDLNPRDPRAVHAVDHVFEMQGRVHDGVEWLTSTAPDWSDTTMAHHNWWHLALHQLDLGEVPAVLELYDRRLRPAADARAPELVDASQLLARIALRGVDVGPRWDELADGWVQAGEDGFNAFNDLHALLAFAFAGRDADRNRMLMSLERTAYGFGTNSEVVASVGLPIAFAILAMASGRPADAVEQLLPVRSRSYRIGGSHAQRDLVQLTCVGAALAAGKAGLARALAAERTEQKPASPHNWRLTARALEAQGGAASARRASEHAELRRRAQLPRRAA
jgi:tetratricopeptide (TPR) repeat protein